MASTSTIDPVARPQVSLNPLLRAKLRQLRRRHVGTASMTGFAILLVFNSELLALALFVDWWLELPWALRLASLLAQAVAATYLLLMTVVAPLIRQPDEDELALMVERARPEFRSRLIAAVQLGRADAIAPKTSPALVSALVRETEDLAGAMDFRQVVPEERVRMFGAAALAVVVLMAAGLFAGRETCGVLLRRWLLSSEPVPRKTRIVVPEGDRRVGIGDSVRLEAFVRGIVPRHGKVEVKGRTRRAQEFPLEQNRDDKIQFGRTLENVQESFTYQFSLGDSMSPVFDVKAVARPTVAFMECEQHYPAYTGLKSTKRSLGDLSLLAGSTFALNVTATKDIKAASLKLVGLEQELPLQFNPGRPREMTGQFNIPARGLTGFQIQMLDNEEMESRDSAVYRIDVLPDKPPVVRITHPDRKEELVTRHATMLIGFEATDDFRVAKVRLKFKSESVDGGAERTVELELEDGLASKLRRRYEWKFSEVMPAVGESGVIEYWLEAEDNNNVTGPGIGIAEHQLARIVNESEKRADLLNRAGDYLGSISDVVADQEKLNRNLGNIIRAKTGMR